jgi:hypothetical protein
MTAKVFTCSRAIRVGAIMATLTNGASAHPVVGRTAGWAGSSASATWVKHRLDEIQGEAGRDAGVHRQRGAERREPRASEAVPISPIIRRRIARFDQG